MFLRHGIRALSRWLVCACLSATVLAQTSQARPKQVYTWERVSFTCEGGQTAYVFTSVFAYCQVDTTPQDVVRAQMAKVNDAAAQACTSPNLDVMVNGRDHPDVQSAEQDRARDMDDWSRTGSRSAIAQITNNVYSTRCAPVQ
jgi:hypothetical protein